MRKRTVQELPCGTYCPKMILYFFKLLIPTEAEGRRDGCRLPVLIWSVTARRVKTLRDRIR